MLGDPAPGGSKRAFRRGSRIVVVDACKRNKPWREIVARTARKHYAGPVLTGTIAITAVFWLRRPKAHHLASGDLRHDVPLAHTVRPDATKLWRAVEDALTGILWRDDAQVAEQTIWKLWAMPDEPPGVWLSVRPLHDHLIDWHTRRGDA